MTLWEALALWLSGYAQVLLLGFQSRNAIAGRYTVCAVTSFLIAWVQVFAWKAAAHEELWMVGTLIGTSGAAGICTAIWINTRWMGLRKT